MVVVSTIVGGIIGAISRHVKFGIEVVASDMVVGGDIRYYIIV